MTNDTYTNEHQKRVVEHLHSRRKATAVEAANNSEIHVYMNHGSLSTMGEALDPYEIDHVKPLNDKAYWSVKVVLRADWTEVEFDDGC